MKSISDASGIGNVTQMKPQSQLVPGFPLLSSAVASQTLGPASSHPQGGPASSAPTVLASHQPGAGPLAPRVFYPANVPSSKGVNPAPSQLQSSLDSQRVNMPQMMVSNCELIALLANASPSTLAGNSMSGGGRPSAADTLAAALRPAQIGNHQAQAMPASAAAPANDNSASNNANASPSATALLLSASKRARSAIGAPEHGEGDARKQQCIERPGSVLSIPANVVVQRFPPPKSSVPGVMAPGPNPADAGCSSTSSELPSCESSWPVLPYMEAVEHLLKDPSAQPLTFHRRVTRPLTRFIAAVATALRMKDTSRLGAGMLFLRALIRDDVYGRLAVYDTMQGHAERADWSAFFQCVCEYLESAGFDISKLFTPRP